MRMGTRMERFGALEVVQWSGEGWWEVVGVLLLLLPVNLCGISSVKKFVFVFCKQGGGCLQRKDTVTNDRNIC